MQGTPTSFRVVPWCPRPGWLLLLPLLLAACASTPPPTGLLEEAATAVERAEQAGAEEHAPIELRFAREKLSGARLATDDGDNEKAWMLSEQSIINAELAVAKTAAAIARAAARAQQQANDELRAELESGAQP